MRSNIFVVSSLNIYTYWFLTRNLLLCVYTKNYSKKFCFKIMKFQVSLIVDVVVGLMILYFTAVVYLHILIMIIMVANLNKETFLNLFIFYFHRKTKRVSKVTWFIILPGTVFIFYFPAFYFCFLIKHTQLNYKISPKINSVIRSATSSLISVNQNIIIIIDHNYTVSKKRISTNLLK